jgi:acyl carrier protein
VGLFKKVFSENCVLANSMGITEAFLVRLLLVDKETQLGGSLLPVGYEVEDKDILLLNDQGNEVGVNCVGEIAVRSRYLSPGYWSRPDLTAGVFLLDPTETGKRIYRTGDLGRMTEDGCLEHLGRKDFRAKIRGFTVEVAEIERALLEHPSIREAVVVPTADQQGDNQLIGYVAVETTTPVMRGLHPTASELRIFLKTKMPDYMIPSAFVLMDHLPLTPNGKIDRKALPVPDQRRPELDEFYVAPRTPVEALIAEIWAEVLNLQKVGVHDNFFDLGGHSLLAAQIISKVLKTLQVELPVRSFFEVPTVAGLAERVETIRWVRQGQQGSNVSTDERQQGDL